jgi:hypothetical protein
MMSAAETPQSTGTTFPAAMADTERETAGGKVLWHFTMSLDGFVAGPNHAMDWMTGISMRPGLAEEYAETTGAVLLGGGIRLFDNPGGAPIRLELLRGNDHSAAVNLRYHPAATGRPPHSGACRRSAAG